MPSDQGRYWMLTVPWYQFIPFLPGGVSYIKGQLEQGAGGFRHWQLLCVFPRSLRLSAVRTIFGSVHAELSRSIAADSYVWKDDTSIPNTRFELGEKPMRRNSKRDWDSVWELAKSGKLEDIDKSILVPHYNGIKRIRQDHLQPVAIERTTRVYWGRTGAGKSRRAWDEAGLDAYPKDPRTKFWDGYSGQTHVVIDEFRGGIDVAHLLRWLDRYPVIVEVKGSSTVFRSTHIWITSNLDPHFWYPDLDLETREALFRRLEIVHFE